MRKVCLVLLVILFAFPSLVSATEYYIDYENGDDTNDGLTKETAWKHSPGDPNAQGNPDSVSLQPGDKVFFKGGVVYSGNIDILSEGLQGNNIIYDGDSWPGLEGTRAIIEGFEPLEGWIRCESQNTCGNNPNWEDIYYAFAPSGINAFTANLHMGGEFLWLAQDPNLPDPYFEDDVENFIGVNPSDQTTTSLKNVSHFDQSDPNYWDGSYILLWTIPNVVVLREINSFDPVTDTVYYDAMNDPSGYNRYSIYNSIHALDSDREYYFNNTPESDGTHKVYLLSKSGLPTDVEISVRKYGININGYSHITIEGFIVRGFSDDSLRGGIGIGTYSRNIDVEGIVIRNNTVTHNNHETGGYGGIYCSHCSYSLIENNEVIKNPRHRSIFIQGATASIQQHVVVRNNTIIKNGHSGVTFYHVNHSMIANNTVINCTGTHANAITVYLYSTNITITGNHVYNSNFCFAYNNIYNITVSYNIFENREGRRAIANGADIINISIHHNTMIGRIDEMNDDAYDFHVYDNIMDSFCYDDNRADVHNNIYTNPIWCQNDLKESEVLETDLSKIFIDAENRDYRILPGTLIGEVPDQKDPCMISSSGSYVGALECVECLDNNPMAVFTVDKSTGYEPLEVRFDASNSRACDTSITDYSWDFGNGDTDSGVIVTKTFNEGTYDVELTVTNSLGYLSSYDRQIMVLPSQEPNLVLYLNFDDNILDMSGRGLQTSWFGTESYSDGLKGKAASFDGISKVEIENHDSLNGMDELTISFWARTTASGPLFRKHMQYHTEIASSGDRLYTAMFNDAGDWLSNDRNFGFPQASDGEWHHYVMWFDGSIYKFYTDNVVMIEEGYVGPVATTTNDLTVGSSLSQYFLGDIDEFKIYDRALTDGEINSIFTGTEIHDSDIDMDGCVNTQEMIAFMDRWKMSSADVGMVELMESIGLWKSGEGCS